MVRDKWYSETVVVLVQLVVMELQTLSIIIQVHFSLYCTQYSQQNNNVHLLQCKYDRLGRIS